VPPSGVLSQPKHQVTHLEVSGPNPPGVVASQGLLIPRECSKAMSRASSSWSSESSQLVWLVWSSYALALGEPYSKSVGKMASAP
jgi:hypothetical protein